MAKLLIYEYRRLVVPLETMVDAVLDFDRERGGQLAQAQITDARIETGERPDLVLEVHYPESPETAQRRYSLPALAAAMIQYCWKVRVPLPRKAAKSMEIVPEGFALTFQSSVEVQRRHAGFSTSARSSSEAPGAAAEARSPEAEAPLSR